ncbi:hypothetical protein BKA56DRAFT_675104 [Ilyonectria sp. MPI-CAGE-AT-0026]|nr:hypothetical protein BKA56DRAFT_675104 [Ilyonectria sp. MPI-CAGE-AT-0026]
MGRMQDVAYLQDHTFSLTGLDQTVAGAGRQNVFFLFDEGFVKQRIDRFHDVCLFFIYDRPNLEPLDFPLVVQSGDDAFSAAVESSYSLFAPGALLQGYRDGLLAAFLVNEATKMSPLLLTTISYLL